MNFNPNKDPESPEADSSGQLKVHYHLRGGMHRMDAVTRNKAEGELLALLREIGHALGVPFQVETRAYGEGGVVEYLDLIFQHKDQIVFIMGLLGTLLGTPFYLAKIKQTKQQTLLNELNLKKLKLEIKEKEDAAAERAEKNANEGKSKPLALEPPITPDDSAQALLGKKKIARRRSNYYEALLEDPKIEAVGFAPTHQKGVPENLVHRRDFGAFVLEQADLEPLVYYQIPIEIVSPVLRSGAIKWRGIFEKKLVSFDLQDDAFRDSVSSKRVQFQNGTTLLCDFEVHQREDETGESEVTGYVVSKVHDVKSPIVAAAAKTEEQLHLHLIARPTGGAAIDSGSQQA